MQHSFQFFAHNVFEQSDFHLLRVTHNASLNVGLVVSCDSVMKLKELQDFGVLSIL